MGGLKPLFARVSFPPWRQAALIDNPASERLLRSDSRSIFSAVSEKQSVQVRSMDDHRQRITPYEDLFDSISENKKIETGLRSIMDMGGKCDPTIREMAQGVLEEIEFFRQRKRGVYYVPYKSTENAGPSPSVRVDGNQVCDPIVLEMCQAVMEEMRYVRSQREMQRRCGYIFIPFFVIFFLVVLSGMIFGFTQMLRNA